ncbi:MAG TPA: Dyp-type peroxidase, partial [Nocardioides sp.]|nr:Dyp-type peroxidase [Nocardioides sp.]
MSQQDDAPRRGVSRRGLIGGGVAAAGVVGAFAIGRSSDGATPDTASAPVTSYPFRGEHQAGIVTPAQDRLHFAAFDVTTDDREALVALLQRWTEAAERMTAGESAGPVGPVEG